MLWDLECPQQFAGRGPTLGSMLVFRNVEMPDLLRDRAHGAVCGLRVYGHMYGVWGDATVLRRNVTW